MKPTRLFYAILAAAACVTGGSASAQQQSSGSVAAERREAEQRRNAAMIAQLNAGIATTQATIVRLTSEIHTMRADLLQYGPLPPDLAKPDPVAPKPPGEGGGKVDRPGYPPAPADPQQRELVRLRADLGARKDFERRLTSVHRKMGRALQDARRRQPE